MRIVNAHATENRKCFNEVFVIFCESLLLLFVQGTNEIQKKKFVKQSLQCYKTN